MKKAFLLLFALLVFSFAGCKNTTVISGEGIAENDPTTSPAVSEEHDHIQASEDIDTSVVEQQNAYLEETPDTAKDEPTSESTAKGGSDYSFARHFIDEVYDIYNVSQIVGQEKCDEWVNNVFLKLTPEEMNALPDLYRAIKGLNVSKEDLIEYNNTDNYPLADYVIEALYEEDVEVMKQALTNPLALYHNGTIYTYDMLVQSNGEYTEIPKDILTSYFDKIQKYCDENKLTKYMQEELDNVKLAYGITE